MAIGFEVGRGGNQAPLRLNTIDGIKLLQGMVESTEVFWISGLHDVQVEGSDWGAVKNGGHSPDDDEFHPFLVEQLYEPKEVSGGVHVSTASVC